MPQTSLCLVKHDFFFSCGDEASPGCSASTIYTSTDGECRNINTAAPIHNITNSVLLISRNNQGLI